MSETKFPRSERLSGRAELEKVRKEGRRRVLPELVLFFLPAPQGRKVAFAASKAVGNSPTRHRVVRKLREFYRLNKQLFPEDCQLFLLVRRPVEDWKGLEARVTVLLGEVKARQSVV